ncbi:endonuclease/exonuclease/phosphatase family protein [Photobacterium sp. S4TG1]|uniref:endonuclease/exonuclease/phosphatase family protein n=1 Tax=Photobacterium sp. S4TG1 TaxID=3114587 RepID=UPI002E17C380|nr:endonuclease/exonuclease/phosphatase family protein [Photobacterium sp. S4TG1]
MQWLSLKQTSPVKRSVADYNALRQLFTTYSPDILAFQEVDSTEALYRIVDKTQYNIYLSDRIHNPQDTFKKNNQYTGFAVKRHIVVNDITDLSQLSSPAIATGIPMPFKNKLRYGSIIEIVINQQSIQLLNLHLKSGCFTETQLFKQKTQACKTLTQQLTLIKQWVETQQQQSYPFIIVGDINHQIVDSRQFLRKISNDAGAIKLLSTAIKANCTVKLVTKKTRIRTYRQLIDHLIATTDIKALSQQQIQYDRQKLLQFTLSDHCPLLFTLSLNSIEKS